MLKRIAGVAIAVSVVVATNAAGSSALVLKAKRHVVHPGMKVGGDLSFGVCGRFTFTGKLEANSSPVDPVGVRKTEGGGGCGEGGPIISAVLKTVKLTSGGEFIVMGDIRYSTGAVAPKHCVWEIAQLTGSFAIPGVAKTSNLSGLGTLDAQLSDAGCPAQEEFKEEEASLARGKTQLLAES
jgi:hypothetical protein